MSSVRKRLFMRKVGHGWSHKKSKSAAKHLLEAGIGDESTREAYVQSKTFSAYHGATADLIPSFKHNSDECLFLSKLSEEIRNTIYEMAIGERDVQVRVKESSGYNLVKQDLQHRVCEVDHALEVDVSRYKQHHAHCPDFDLAPNRLPLDLLRTCRQIHNEAALLQFTTVNYVIEVHAFTPFLRALIKPQKEVLKRLTILVDGHRSEASRTIGELRDLVNVRRLRIIVTGADATSFGGLHKLARSPLEEVDISFHIPWYNEGRGEQIQEAADSLKAYLLRPWKGIEMEEKSAAKERAAAWKQRVSKRQSLQDRQHTVRAGRGLRNMKKA